MGNFFRNWKTTGSGLVAILTGVGEIFHSVASKQPINWNVTVPAIIGGIGLLFAKDATTHSTETEVQKATATEKK